MKINTRLHRLTIGVLVGGTLVTAGLAIASRVNYVHSEQRQVSAQTKLAAASLAVAPVDVQRRLGRAATVAAATEDLTLFNAAIATSLPNPFVSVMLFDATGSTPREVQNLGEPAQLDPHSDHAIAVVRKAMKSTTVVLDRLATPTTQRFGYAVAASVAGRTYVAYGEQILPGDRRAPIPPNSPLAGMDYALYFGTTEAADKLILTNADDLPLHGRRASAPIQFGQATLTAVIQPRTALLGWFAASIAWIIGGAGVLMTLLVAVLTERLLRRRVMAEQFAKVTDQLYRSQRSVAETLQQSLLPTELPHPPQLQVATRYRAGTAGIDVGGDWYDLTGLDEHRVFFTVGDVSGRGLSAATTMSRLRHTIAAYAQEGHDPAAVLDKVSALIDVVRDRHFATVVCGVVDARSGKATVANAGHPPPLLVTAEKAEPICTPVGPPLGVGTHYDSAEIDLAPGAVLLAYTDGLIERRDEPISTGLDRLRDAAGPPRDLDEMLDAVLAALIPDGATDDTAVLGLRLSAIDWVQMSP